jgi:hypothetical protein
MIKAYVVGETCLLSTFFFFSPYAAAPAFALCAVQKQPGCRSTSKSTAASAGGVAVTSPPVAVAESTDSCMSCFLPSAVVAPSAGNWAVSGRPGPSLSYFVPNGFGPRKPKQFLGRAVPVRSVKTVAQLGPKPRRAFVGPCRPKPGPYI